jgi:hypothetical protein
MDAARVRALYFDPVALVSMMRGFGVGVRGWWIGFSR